MKHDALRNLWLSSKLNLFSRNVLSLNVDINDFKFFSTTTRTKTHYETLKLPSNCTTKDIKAAFISLSKQYHPDKNRGNAKAQELFVQINEAYNVLIKPESRKTYDLTLSQNSPYSRDFNSSSNSEFYEVHRQQTNYRDPWKDPSFARNRNFSQTNEGDYYGVKGLKKQSNETIRRWLIIYCLGGLIIQIIFIRSTVTRNLRSNERKSEENRQYLSSVRERAERLGTRERQLEDLRQRVILSSEK